MGLYLYKDYTMTINKIKLCEGCGREFLPRPERYDRSRCCSRKCLYNILGKINSRIWQKKHTEWAGEPRENYVDIMREAFE